MQGLSMAHAATYQHTASIHMIISGRARNLHLFRGSSSDRIRHLRALSSRWLTSAIWLLPGWVGGGGGGGTAGMRRST